MPFVFALKHILYLVLFSLGLLFIATGLYLTYSTHTKTLGFDQVRIEVVKEGNLYTKINGQGRLFSKHQRIITSRVGGIVDFIALKPGAAVEEDTLIARLTNSEIEHLAQEALYALNNEKFKYRKLLLEHKRELIELETEQDQNLIDLEMLNLQADAERVLVTKGVMSDIQYQKTQLKIKKKQQSHQGLIKKIQSLRQVHQEALSIQKDTVEQFVNQHQIVTDSIDALVIKAGFKGIIQTLDIVLGQNIQQGHLIATVGDPINLGARIRVPEIHSHLLFEGMDVKLSTLNQQHLGILEQIDPIVKEGAVSIEVSLNESRGFLPMQNVKATLLANKLQNVMYINQADNHYNQNSDYVYTMVSDNKAKKTAVTLGKHYDDKVLVISGLKKGDRILKTRQPIKKTVQAVQLIR